MVRKINRGEFIGWKSMRNAVEAMLNGTTSEDLFGADAPAPSAADVKIVGAMEAKVDRIVSMVAGGWRDGESIIAAKVSPDRAALMADKLVHIRRHLVTMERELRNIAAQAQIALRA
jgi:ParB family transcriptional regulator, chromosome partitioning protein